MTTRPDLSEYRAMAEDAFRLSRATGKRWVVSNRGTHHAQAVTDVLVSSAVASLSFLCRGFPGEVFDTALIEKFLGKPGTRLDVLLDGDGGATDRRPVGSGFGGGNLPECPARPHDTTVTARVALSV